jgi:small subunit ribosomal protein S6
MIAGREMTKVDPTYDLVLLLDTEADEAVREKILADIHEAISARGEIVRHDKWGNRTLTYPIEHKTSAEYHLFQFHVGSAELLSELNRSLHITDGVVRFRVVKLKPGTPPPPDMSTVGDIATAVAESPPVAEPALNDQA